MRNKICLAFFALFMSCGARSAPDSVLAFTETQIILHTTAGDLSGTMTLPKGSGRFPVALIIAGSGPTDRNGNNQGMENGSLKMLAHGLGNRKIASVRFDKRGVAESAASAKNEADLRFEDYINDAKDWVALLKKDKRFSSLFIIGHSEGSLIGMLVTEGKADGFISIAGAGKRVDKVIKDQLAGQPQMVKDIAFPILDSLVAGRTVEKVDPMLQSMFRPSVQPYLISWIRYDPEKEISKLRMPVMVVNGTNDIQVSEENAKLLADASGTDAVLIKNMNHVLKIVEGDRAANIATYSDPALPISTELIDAVATFIIKN